MTSLLTHPQYQYFQLLSRSDWRDLARLTKQEQNIITATCNLFKLKREQGDFPLSKQFKQACRALNRHIAINRGAKQDRFIEKFSTGQEERAVKLASCISQCWQEHIKNIDCTQKGLVEVEGDLSKSHLILIGETHKNMASNAIRSALITQYSIFERNTVLIEGLPSGEVAKDLEYNAYYFPSAVQAIGWDNESLLKKHLELRDRFIVKVREKTTRPEDNIQTHIEARRLCDLRTESLIERIRLSVPSEQHRIFAIAGNHHIYRKSEYDIRKALSAHKLVYVRITDSTYVEGTPFSKIDPKEAFQNEYKKKIFNRKFAIALAIIQALGLILTGSILALASFSVALLTLASLFLIGTVSAAVWASRACPWSKQ